MSLLLRQPDAAEQVFVSRVGAERFKSWILLIL